jgi:DNA helicase-2/ATP-dependent DNA helicase PcrA
MPSRFLEEVPSQLIENLGGQAQASAWSATPGYSNTFKRRAGNVSDFGDRHYNYEDENQDAPRTFASPGVSAKGKPFVASWMTASALPGAASQGASSKSGSAEASESPNSIDNIARFFGGASGHAKPGSLPRPASAHSSIDHTHGGASNLKKGQRVRHSKYGEGTVLMREGDGEDAKLTVLFSRHGMKKLMEKFANLQKI